MRILDAAKYPAIHFRALVPNASRKKIGGKENIDEMRDETNSDEKCAKLNDNIAMEAEKKRIEKVGKKIKNIRNSNIFHYFMCLYARATDDTKQEKCTNTTALAVNKKKKQPANKWNTTRIFVWNGTKQKESEEKKQ